MPNTPFNPMPLNPNQNQQILILSLMAQQIATSKPNSSFTVPANHVVPNLSAWTFPTTGCSVPNATISVSAPQGLSRAPNTKSGNNTTVPQVRVLFTT